MEKSTNHTYLQVPILKLRPACKDYLWGGHRLMDAYHKSFDGSILAETWELSCHPDGPSVLENGPDAGKTLAEYIQMYGKQVLGTNCSRFNDFPVLIKFIDANDNLSIQVHPDDPYALAHEHQLGKTEMWFVADCQPDSYLYYGFRTPISKEEFSARIAENTLTDVLHQVSVQPGDTLFIEAGTIHAIGKGILIADIQQNSNVTYRVYDYGRKDPSGKQRDLHIEKALAVTNRVPIRRKSFHPHIGACDYFTVDHLLLDGSYTDRMSGCVQDASFLSILMLSGEGVIKSGAQCVPFRKGDSFFLPAGIGRYEICGQCEALLTSIP